MSYILDALRKSEAERHQEGLPESLARQQAMLLTANRRSSIWPWLICILLLVNVAILGYFVFNFQKQPAQPTEITPVVQGAQVLQPPQTGSQIAPQTQQGQYQQQSSTSQNMSHPTVQAPSQPVQTYVEEAPELITPRNQQQQDAAQPSYLIEPPVEEQPLLISPRGEQRTPPTPASAKPANTPKTAAKPTASAARPKDVPHIAELDRHFIRTLPNLQFNSHIYSADPSGRRIMINSIYLREGQHFSGMSVIEITNEGVVLEKNDTKFWVPVVSDWSPDK